MFVMIAYDSSNSGEEWNTSSLRSLGNCSSTKQTHHILYIAVGLVMSNSRSHVDAINSFSVRGK